jgi:DNA repair protein RecN (Recombination protein N)
VLRTLYIRDYAIIDELEIAFEPGLNILTGETGAGKSILVGALTMILGERASTDTLRTDARKAVIEGVFEGVDPELVGEALDAGGIDPAERLILRREITGSQSRAFINDSPATVQVLRDVASGLVDLHGQHEHQSLLRPETHRALLDSVGGLGDLVDACRAAFDQASRLEAERRELAARERELAAQKELWSFQIEEIDRVAPEPGEEDRLESERRILENAERLHEATTGLFGHLYEEDGAAYDRLTLARNELRELARIDPAFDDALREIESAQVAVGEIARFLQDYSARIEFNPERLDDIRDRLGALDRLKRRYGGSLEAVLEHRAEIGSQHDLASDFAGALARLDARIASARRDLSEAAERLSARRLETAARVEEAVVGELAGLGMAGSRFEVRLEREADPDGWITAAGGGRFRAWPHGMDRVAFQLSTNPGEEPRPLVRVASGGEVSRVMLALKSILARSDRLPILVFDEIDTGVSGAMAQRVGERLRDLAGYHQVLAITHLPQVAAQADAHFRVEKHVADGRTRTTVRRLSDGERTEEVATLISGTRVTDAARESARELIRATG